MNESRINRKTCYVCGGAKVVIVEKVTQRSTTKEIRRESWSYSPKGGERIVDGFCSGCGIRYWRWR